MNNSKKTHAEASDRREHGNKNLRPLVTLGTLIVFKTLDDCVTKSDGGSQRSGGIHSSWLKRQCGFEIKISEVHTLFFMPFIVKIS